MKMRQFLRFSLIARDCKINAREGVKMRHFRAKSQHLDTLGGSFPFGKDCKSREAFKSGSLLGI